MRLIVATILFIFFAFTCSATIYFVHPSTGNDLNNGFSDGTAWATVAKINSFTFQFHDSILVYGGDSLVGKIIVTKDTLYFGSYGTGLAHVTAFKSANLTLKSGSIYVANFTDAAPSLNTVFVDGTLRIKSRYPNNINSWLTYTSTGGIQSNLPTTLPNSPSYVGFPIVVKSSMFTIDRSVVTAQSSGNLTLSPLLTYDPVLGGNGFFFQNDSTLIDSVYEWSEYSNGRFLIQLPSLRTVLYSTQDTIFRLRKVKGVVIENLDITGANKIGIQFDSNYAPVIRNCNISYMGYNGVAGLKTNHADINSNHFINILNDAMWMRGLGGNHRIDTCKNTNIRNNYIDSVAVYPGMGESDNGNYIGIYMVGDSCKVYNNVFKHIGYHGMYIVGRGDSVTYNYFDSFCITKNDGAAMYSWLDGSAPVNDGGSVWPHDWDSGMVWDHNIGLHGIGNVTGTDPLSIYYGAGSSVLYTDLNSNNIDITNNTAAYNSGNNLSIGAGAHNDTITGNTLLNNKDRNRDLLGTSVSTYGMLFKNDIYYLYNSTSPSILDGYINAGQVSDSNRYFRPEDTTKTFKSSTSFYSLSQWKTATGRENGSNATMPTAISSTVPVIVVNPTLHDSTVVLDRTYIDLDGIIYSPSNALVLHSFQSKILLPYIVNYSNAALLKFH